MTSHPNPELYQEMNAPYESEEAAQEALEAFVDAVRELRRRHRIGDVAVVASVRTSDDNRYINWGGCGDSRLTAPLLLHALSCERARLAEPLEQFDRSLEELRAGVGQGPPSPPPK